jgi:hypothetical protein
MRNRALAGLAPMVGMALVASCASAGEVFPDARPAADAARGDAPPIDGPSVDMCPSAATCQTATVLGSISGDTGNQKLHAMGFQAAWFRVRVTEDYNNILYGRSLRAAAKVTSPPGVAFDVVAYVNAGNDVVECANTTGTKSVNGDVTQTRTQWGEGGSPNGADDDRWLSIEVRPLSTACAPGALWQLEVEGNWK